MRGILRFVGTGIVVALTVAAAPVRDAKDEVKAAVKKLSEAGGYSWTSTFKSQGGPGGGQAGRFQPGPMEGKTDKDGLIWVQTSFGDNKFEALVKKEKSAIKTPDGSWLSAEELRERAQQGGGQGGRGFGGLMRGVRAPADQLAGIIEKTSELKSDGDAIAGKLTEEGAKELMSFGGGRRGQGGEGQARGPQISGAEGSLKIWLKDGQLVKYEYTVKGTMTIREQEIEMNRTTTVEIKDVGSTKIEVPEEAKAKLG
jgi:hypothetical protein